MVQLIEVHNACPQDFPHFRLYRFFTKRSIYLHLSSGKMTLCLFLPAVMPPYVETLRQGCIHEETNAVEPLAHQAISQPMLCSRLGVSGTMLVLFLWLQMLG
jgi:hypothetical protein